MENSSNKKDKRKSGNNYFLFVGFGGINKWGKKPDHTATSKMGLIHEKHSAGNLVQFPHDINLLKKQNNSHFRGA